MQIRREKRLEEEQVKLGDLQDWYDKSPRFILSYSWKITALVITDLT